MCGIAGVTALGERPIDPVWGLTLLEALGHRGPDGQDVFREGRVLLAHTRNALPLADWLRGPLAPWVDGLLAPLRLWALATLEFWARRFGMEIAA